jgi:hypothetical protein
MLRQFTKSRIHGLRDLFPLRRCRDVRPGIAYVFERVEPLVIVVPPAETP